MGILLQSSTTSSQSHLCRSSCGDIPINYPFAIDDGCGSPYYRHMLICSDNNTKLELRTPSGKYPVKSISYSDPHLLVSDPFMWNCQDRNNFRPTRSFSIDSSTHFTVSPQNDYLFFNCDSEKVIVSQNRSSATGFRIDATRPATARAIYADICPNADQL